MKIKELKAFTLVELAITISIIIILSSISVPIYKDYIGQSKWSEGYTLIATIRDAQMAYYNQYGNFYYRGTNWTNNDDVLRIDARTGRYATWFNCGIGYNNQVKYEFRAGVSGLSSRNWLKMTYNLTTGVTYAETQGNLI